MGSCSSRSVDEDSTTCSVRKSTITRQPEYEFEKHLPKATVRFKEPKALPLKSKADIVTAVQDEKVDDSWRVLAQEKFAGLHQITNNLFLTSFMGLNREELTIQEIGYLINATLILPKIREFEEQTLRVPVEDDRGADIYPFLDHTADAIHELLSSGKKVLVHCQAGVSRSAALVMAYLIKYERRTLRNAFRLVHDKRPVIRPNTTFLHALTKFEKMNLHSASTKIIQVRKNGQVMELPNWLYYDIPAKFADEFLEIRSKNAAKYVNPTQLLVDLDKDADAFNQNRELILGEEPIGKPTLSIVNDLPASGGKVLNSARKPSTHPPPSPPPAVVVPSEFPVPVVKTVTHVHKKKTTNFFQTPGQQRNLRSTVKTSSAHQKTQLQQQPHSSLVSESVHKPSIVADDSPSAKLPVTTAVTKNIVARQNSSELALFPHQRSRHQLLYSYHK